MRVHELFDMHGKVAIVTGGATGIGRQMAEALADCGADLVLCARNAARCADVARHFVDTYGVRAVGLGCDVRDPEQVQAIVEQTRTKFGRIDVLVNNSGVAKGGAVADIPLKEWQLVLDVNLTGVWLFAQQVTRVLIDQGEGGKIVNIASVGAFIGGKPGVMDAVAYNASKGGVVALTKDLAVKLAPHRIQVNAIAPGMFPTEMSEVPRKMGNNYLLDRAPAGRFGSDDDLKGAIAYLASRASDFVTGHTLVVDGGTLAS